MTTPKYPLYLITNKIKDCKPGDIIDFVSGVTKDCSLYTQEEIATIYDLLANRMMELKDLSESNS